ncbi:MAG TPA: outer membrane protein assembly factor BamA, partial [Clostridia bacterium]|nr:outer membrane protein assembly factor BamA [Clostridia bacterium]
MKELLRFCGLLLFLACHLAGFSQPATSKISSIDVKFVGPQSVSDELVRSNIRVKVGDPFLRPAVDDDVRNLYATGLFYNIQVAETAAKEGTALTYIVQGKPRLTEVKFEGNVKYSDSKLRKKVTSKVGEPLDERKLFTDTQELEQMYQKAGYPRTEVKYTINIDENAGRGTVTFEITENPKIKIVRVEFPGATQFPEKRLRKLIKTRKHWMFSWITGSGKLKDDQLEEDRERLTEFYRNNGYIDFDIKDVQLENPTARTVIVRFIVEEGREYRVGSIKFEGNKIFSLQEITNGLRTVHFMKGEKGALGLNGLPMDEGDVFSPKGLAKDTEAVEDFYGAKGYVDVGSGRTLNVIKIPNTQTGTMDLEFRIEEGQQSYIEKIEIRGNTKTKDKVIRRELAVSPGEVFDMVRVKRSRQRLEGLQYFEKVDARPEPTDVP